MGFIYQCTNLINNKIYIGQTTRSLKERKAEHLHKVINDGTYFHNALLKYGADNFVGIFQANIPMKNQINGNIIGQRQSNLILN